MAKKRQKKKQFKDLHIGLLSPKEQEKRHENLFKDKYKNEPKRSYILFDTKKKVHNSYVGYSVPYMFKKKNTKIGFILNFSKDIKLYEKYEYRVLNGTIDNFWYDSSLPGPGPEPFFLSFIGTFRESKIDLEWLGHLSMRDYSSKVREFRQSFQPRSDWKACSRGDIQKLLSKKSIVEELDNEVLMRSLAL